MGRLAAHEFAQFNGLLASAVERQVPLVPAIELLAAQTRKSELRRGLEVTARALKDGATLAEALARSPEVFPPEYAALVDAGLRGGRLAEVLRHSETYDTLRARVARRLTELLAYLAVGALVLLTIVTVLSIIGQQHAASVREQLRWAEGPVLLQWFEDYWWVTPAAFTTVLVLIALTSLAITRWRLLGGVAFSIPLWRRLVRSRDLALFSTTMAVRLGAGATTNEALTAAERSVGNRAVQRKIQALSRRVHEGEGLSTALFYDSFFPRTLAWAVSMGEARGEVADVFDLFARLYSAELERNFGLVLQILTPLGLLALGNIALFAGILVLAPFGSTVAMLR